MRIADGLINSVLMRYSDCVAAKSATGIETPNITKAPNRAACGFFVPAARACRNSMVDWAGEPKGSPGSLVAGSLNPVQLTTHEIETSGGDNANTTKGLPIMVTFLPVSTPQVQIIEGKAVTTSLAVAEYFGRLHKNVIQRIENLDCSPEFRRANFSAVEKINELGLFEKLQPYYQITRDGFTFLAMGFTGKRAARFKEAYISEFNRMEATLRTPVVTPASPLTISCSPNRIPMHQMFAGGWCVQLNILLAALMNAEVQGQTVKVVGIYQAWAELDSLCAELEKYMGREL